MHQTEEIHGASGRIRELLRIVDAVALGDAPVLLVGEPGAGKQRLARAIHARSARRDRPFVAVPCGALGPSMLEAELFGSARGAVPGQAREQRGLVDAAAGGTLFLDEIGEVPPAIQSRLLRLLEEGGIRRVGAVESIPVELRVVAATHRDLSRLVKAGAFREELLVRLHAVTISVPALRERLEDVPILAHHFLRRSAERLGKRALAFSPTALELLCAWRWPGNVGELEGVVEQAVARSRGETVGPAELPPEIAGRGAPAPFGLAAGAGEASWLELGYAEAKEQALRRFERNYVEALLKICGGNISAAARKAGMDRSNFKRVLRKSRGEEEPERGGEAPSQLRA